MVMSRRPATADVAPSRAVEARAAAVPARPRRRLALGALVLFLSWSPQAGADEALARAAELGSAAQVRALLAGGADVDAPLPDASTALHWAVLRDQLETTRQLLAAGADPQAENRNGVTPLYLAAQNGNVDVVTELLDAGASPNASARTGETMLMTAVRTGRPEVVELLLAHAAIVDARDPEFEQTALMIAVREGYAGVVETLLRHGADPDARTRLGPPPPFLPPCKGTGCGSEGVGINRGGRPDRGVREPRRGHMTPLLYAARDGHVEAARRLIDAGADIELREANDITALLMALINNHLDVAHLLLDHGAQVNVEDFWGRTPLFAAVDSRNLDINASIAAHERDNSVDRAPVLDIIARLLEAGAHVNARTRERPPEKIWLHELNDVSWVDVTGQTPFFRAAFSGDVAIMRLLLAHGADPHLPTFLGTTPLMAAAGVNWTVGQTYTESDEALMEAVKLCLELGADVNATNSMGLTALIGAVNRGSNDLIRVLVDHGARLDVADAVGRTPLRWAEGVFLAAVGAEQKPETIALLHELMAAAGVLDDAE
jgi:uncharacterized protein